MTTLSCFYMLLAALALARIVDVALIAWAVRTLSRWDKEDSALFGDLDRGDPVARPERPAP